MNTSLLKIRRIPPVAPVAPVGENDEGKSSKITGGNQNTGGITSSDTKIPPANNDPFHAQITSDIDNTGGTGGTGGIMQKKGYHCHYCNFSNPIEEDLVRHSINAHPGKVAQPDESILKLDEEKESEEEEVK